MCGNNCDNCLREPCEKCENQCDTDKALDDMMDALGVVKTGKKKSIFLIDRKKR